MSWYVRKRPLKPPFEIYRQSTGICDQDGHVCTAENEEIANTIVLALNSFLKRNTDRDTLADILAMKYVGNFAADRANFDRVDAFLKRPDVPVGDKFVADYVVNLYGCGQRLRYLDMGAALNISTEEFYNNFAEYCPGEGYTK